MSAIREEKSAVSTGWQLGVFQVCVVVEVFVGWGFEEVWDVRSSPFLLDLVFVGPRVRFGFGAVRVGERVGAESRVWFNMQYAI